jgi:DNA-binding HxlR family transcriptional regulator
MISPMRTYGQACVLAKALDVVGDRWTLLIVRELMIRGACRYTDLQAGLPGVATNLLADRLTELTDAGLISREAAPPPVATALFRLTRRGAELEPVIDALGRWGAPLLATTSSQDVFRSHWLALPVRLYVRDASPSSKPARVEIRTGGEAITLETVGDGSVTTRVGAVANPDARLEGTPTVVLGFLMGTVSLAAARRRGLKSAGNRAILRRFRRTRPASARLT